MSSRHKDNSFWISDKLWALTLGKNEIKTHSTFLKAREHGSSSIFHGTEIMKPQSAQAGRSFPYARPF